jgi:16S rRNA processing protein RimM
VRAPDRLVLVGRFGAPQGVRGEIRVQSFTGDPNAIGGYGPLTDSGRTRDFVFERLRPLKADMLVVKVGGVETRDAAGLLTGVELFARRDRLPEPSEDEFYVDDLVGLSAATAGGQALGQIVAVSNYGAGDILEIAPEGGAEPLLLPFTKAVAPAIDFAGGKIVIEPPEEVEERSGSGRILPPEADR